MATGDRIFIGPFPNMVDASIYGSLAQAVASADTLNKTIVVSSSFVVDSDLVIPVTRGVKVVLGGSIYVNEGITLTINGPFEAGNYQVFTNVLDNSNGIEPRNLVLFGEQSVGKVRAIWYGAGCNVIPYSPWGYDDYPAIQAAVFSVTFSSSVSVVEILEGTYNLSFPVGIYRWVNNSYAFVTCEIICPTMSQSGLRAAKIVATYLTAPALWMQSARCVKIKGIQFYGQNTINFSLAQVMEATTSEWAADQGARDNANSPYAGVVIDPFCDVASLLEANRYPSMDIYYSFYYGSSRLKIEECDFYYFTVGVMITPNPDTQNADNIALDDCYCYGCKVFVAVGQSQSRSVYINRCISWGSVKVFCDCLNYGNGNAPLPNIVGGQIAGGVKYLLCFNKSWGYGFVDGMYCETLGSLGYATGDYPLTFKDCYFSFANNYGGGTKELQYHGYFTGPVAFEGCYIGKYLGVVAPINLGPTLNNYKFTNCNFDQLPTSPRIGYHAFNSYFENVSLKYSDFQSIGGAASENKVVVCGGEMQLANRKGFLKGSVIAKYAGDETYEGNKLFKITEPELHVPLGYLNYDVSGRVALTSVDPQIVKADDFLYVGDYAYATGLSYESLVGTSTAWGGGIIGRVMSANSSSVTLKEIPNVFSEGVNTSYYTYMVCHTLFHMPTVGTLTLSSPVVSNVMVDGRVGVSGLATTWVSGDRVQGKGVAPGSFVVNVSNNATLTLSRPAIAAGVVGLFGTLFKMVYCDISGPELNDDTSSVWVAGSIWVDPTGASNGGRCISGGCPGSWTNN